jgi:hypothetical protein
MERVPIHDNHALTLGRTRRIYQLFRVRRCFASRRVTAAGIQHTKAYNMHRKLDEEHDSLIEAVTVKLAR